MVNRIAIAEGVQPITPITSPRREFKGHRGNIRSAAVFPDGCKMVTVSYDKTLRLWDLKDGALLKEMVGDLDCMLAVAVAGNGKLLASGDEAGELIVWDGDTGAFLTRVTQPIKGHSEAISSLDFSPDSAVLASVSWAGTMKLWRTDTWDVQADAIKAGADINCVRFSPSGKLLAIATGAYIQIWNASGSECIAKFSAEGMEWNFSLAWTPDGTRLFSAGSDDDPTIREWDMSTWKQVGHPWIGHTKSINALAINSTGTSIASASWDNHMRLWQLSDQQTIAIFRHSGPVLCGTFSVDGRHILSGGFDKMMSEWAVPEHAFLRDTIDEQASEQASEVTELNISAIDAESMIRKVINTHMETKPPHLINTSNGRLCNRNPQIHCFTTSIEYKRILSATMKEPNLPSARTHDVVSTFFQHVMLSHRWEANEPLIHDIQGQSIYSINPVVGITKLQAFCKIARDRGYQWAWSDTCCIDKSTIIELQQSINSMFVWYRHSVLTVVYLSDVLPSSKPGALARSVWTRRGWTVQEFLAPTIVLFYQNDWTLYLDDHSPNHKESPAIMRELASATGINPQALVAFDPGMKGAREKLQWASKRETTMPEDIAYSLFGVLGVQSYPNYGENRQNALGRLLQEVIARSGDLSCLDWAGKSSEFNSCLPASITSYAAPPFNPPSLSEGEVKMSVVELRAAGVVGLASELYAKLDDLATPRFAQRRLQLHCIVFLVTQVSLKHSQRQDTCTTYAVKATGLHDLLITTEDKLIPFPRMMNNHQRLLLVRPWDRDLLEQHKFEELSEPVDDDDDDDAQSITTDAFFTPPSSPRGDDVDSVDTEPDSHALRLVVRLRRPFRALLLAQRGGEYNRIAADYDITAQVNNIASIRDLMDVRPLEIL